MKRLVDLSFILIYFSNPFRITIIIAHRDKCLKVCAVTIQTMRKNLKNSWNLLMGMCISNIYVKYHILPEDSGSQLCQDWTFIPTIKTLILWLGNWTYHMHCYGKRTCRREISVLLQKWHRQKWEKNWASYSIAFLWKRCKFFKEFATLHLQPHLSDKDLTYCLSNP